jgi:hypothetical protein
MLFGVAVGGLSSQSERRQSGGVFILPDFAMASSKLHLRVGH